MTEDEMRKEIAALVCRVLNLERDCRRFMRERDEARRKCCEMVAAKRADGRSPQDVAADLGWASAFDPVDTRGLHGDPKEPRMPRQELKMGSWVDEGSHA